MDNRHAASLHPLAQRSVAEFLRLADARLPGVVERLYLVGSIALGDFHAGVSDVDFLAVTAEPLDDATLDGLERIHRRLQVAAWTIENLNSYWTGLAKRAHRALSADGGWIGPVDARMAAWGVLGVARLHDTLVTGGITSKSGAGSTPWRSSGTAGLRSSGSACAFDARTRGGRPG